MFVRGVGEMENVKKNLRIWEKCCNFVGLNRREGILYK